MDDLAAFEATFAGMSSLTDGDYSVRFHVSGPNIKKLFDILSQGDKPSIAKGTWFAIARLSSDRSEAEDCDDSPTTGSRALRNVTKGKPAPGNGSSSDKPARALSNRIYLRLCNNPVGRRFLEEFCQDIVQLRPVNNAEFAKDIIRLRLGVASLSEVDSDPVASEQAEQLLNLFAGWERGLETPRIQQTNEASGF